MKLLFFSPYCGRTGSELALYQLISHAKNPQITKAVACGAGGALNGTFSKDVPVFRYWHALSFADQAFKQDSVGLHLAQRVFNAHIRLIHARVKPDAWYINTIVQPKVLALAMDLNVPCILHTHEYQYALSVLKANEIEDMVSYPKLVIAASQCAADVFHTLGRRNHVEVCHEPVVLSDARSSEGNSAKLRKDLNIADDAFVWAMSGSRDPRKNPLSFVQIAAGLLQQEPRSHFLWIGGAETGYGAYAKEIARGLKIKDRLSWVPPQTNDYFDYLNVADAFVLTSVDDTFPIVMLEAAALGKPIVSFASGGASEFVTEGMGAVTSSWNADDMVRTMLDVMRGNVRVSAEAAKARAGEFDLSIIVKKWEGILLRYSDKLISLNSSPR